ncbi:flagellar basal body rod protein FlgC [Hahella sp. CCB-MM4]|uniref:flagellar basal body rod protein FlgC n=1 Tax=Hahella sp. (strain CCB-MM4) TaxID=1926491 RepID=UPI000B9B5964|nr:flagellar basal body rod protein FlgC [Hahella sp. CCB-MM4]OZG73860.1 flagellar basal body rod protein FlgC [Hahella sp. CCB-MM4]
MAINSIFDIAGSALSAQSVRLNTTASNLANAESASSSIDETYRARKPVFAAIQQDALADAVRGDINQEASRGVEVLGIVESQDPLQRRYEPDHPMADEQGYVFYPNVNVVEEMADMMSATRSFQINTEVLNSAKTMMQRLLTLGQ